MIIEFNPFPVLQTERLILRRLAMSDLEALHALRSDDEVNKYLNRPKTSKLEETEAYIKKIDGLVNDNISMYWVLALKDHDTLIGTICIWNCLQEKDMADIGYELSPAQQGKGLMNEAIEKVIAFGFDEMELKILIGVAHPENERSLNVLKRNGFIEDAEFIYVSKEEVEGDVVYYLARY